MALRNTLRPFMSALEAPFRHTPVGTPASLLGTPPSFWQPPSTLFSELLHQPAFPAVSVEEKGNGYEILADLAGYKKDDVKVRLADANRRLILEGESKTAEVIEEPEGGAGQQAAGEKPVIVHEGEDAMTDPDAADEVARSPTQAVGKATGTDLTKAWLIDERAKYSAFRRAFEFPQPLNPASIKAKLADGQLKVTVAKEGEAEGIVDVNIE